MYIDTTYKSSQRAPYPSHDINPEQKTEVWHLEMAKALYSNFLSNNCATKYSDYVQITTNRRYANGMQDWLPYKDTLIGPYDPADPNSDKGWANIDFKKLICVMPKFVRVMLGIFESQEHKIECNAFDEDSSMMRENAKWTMWAKKENKAFLEYINAATGATAQSQEFEPASREEMELFESMGGFKLKTEVAMEGAFDAVEYFSSWRNIRKELFMDEVTNGRMCAEDYVDPFSQKVMVRYVDIENFVCVKDSNDNISKAGKVVYMTIEEVMNETGITEQQARALATKYKDKLGNPSSLGGGWMGQSGRNEKTGAREYDDWKVPVFVCEFVSVDRTWSTSRIIDGSPVIFEEPWRVAKDGTVIEPKVYDKPGKKTSRVDARVLRKCKWAIGGELCWDWGLQHDIPRPNKDTALSSFHYRVLPGKSIVESCIPDLDAIEIANKRIQNAMAMAPNSGFVYDYSALEGMTLGGKDMKPLDIVRLHRQSGSALVKPTSHRGIRIAVGSVNPIIELKGGIGPLLSELLTIIQYHIQNIQAVTGINEIVDASNPNPEVTLGQSQIAIASTNNSLKPLYSAFIDLQEKLATNCMLRLQIVAKYKKGYWTYDKSLGKAAWETIATGADFSLAQMGIKVQAMPTQKDMQDIEVMLNQAIASGKNGKAAMTLSEYFAVKRILSSGGSLKHAQVLIAYREQKNTEDELKLQQDNMELNKKNEQETLALKSQLEDKANATKQANEKEIITYTTDEEIRKARALHELTMAEIKLTNSLKPAETTDPAMV